MAKKDIYKIDNYFITMGIIFLVVGSIAIAYNWPGAIWVTKQGSSYTVPQKGRTLDQIKKETGADSVEVSGFPGISTLILISGLSMLVIGIVYRVRENKIISIWNALDQTGESKVNDLAASLGIKRSFVLAHLKEINAQQVTYYIWDHASDKIVDAKLMTEFLVVAECKNCGAKINEKVHIDLTILPKCQYCGGPVSTAESLNRLKVEVLTTHETVVAAQKATANSFNIVIFILLLMIFWPAAVGYFIYTRTNISLPISVQFTARKS